MKKFLLIILMICVYSTLNAQSFITKIEGHLDFGFDDVTWYCAESGSIGLPFPEDASSTLYLRCGADCDIQLNINGKIYQMAPYSKISYSNKILRTLDLLKK